MRKSKKSESNRIKAAEEEEEEEEEEERDFLHAPYGTLTKHKITAMSLVLKDQTCQHLISSSMPPSFKNQIMSTRLTLTKPVTC